MPRKKRLELQILWINLSPSPFKADLSHLPSDLLALSRLVLLPLDLSPRLALSLPVLLLPDPTLLDLSPLVLHPVPDLLQSSQLQLPLRALQPSLLLSSLLPPLPAPAEDPLPPSLLLAPEESPLLPVPEEDLSLLQ